jgi:hypothetical protein
VKDISFEKWQEQPYDPLSIMNECTSADAYYTESNSNSTINGKLLSNSDIKRVQQFYGAPAIDRPHLLKNNQFFTGLYKEKDAYHYYENGIRIPEYESITEVEINKIFETKKIDEKRYDKKFVIHNTNDEKGVLFKYEPAGSEGKLPNFIIPESSLLTFCIKPDDKGKVVGILCEKIFYLDDLLSYGLLSENPTKATLYYEIKQDNKFRLHACDATKTLDDGKKQNISYSLSDLTCVYEDKDENLLVNLLFDINNDVSPSNYYFFKGKRTDLSRYLENPN